MRIFVSYRRSDTLGELMAHVLFRELGRLPEVSEVFLDVDSISPGLPFPTKLSMTLAQTDVVFAIIGPKWLASFSERKSDERDWVRFELEESLKRSSMPIVPIAVGGATLPSSSELPDSICTLAQRDGITLDPLHGFQKQLQYLVERLGPAATAYRQLERQRLEKAELSRKVELLKVTPPSLKEVLSAVPFFTVAAAFVGFQAYIGLGAIAGIEVGIVALLIPSWLYFVTEYRKFWKYRWKVTASILGIGVLTLLVTVVLQRGDA